MIQERVLRPEAQEARDCFEWEFRNEGCTCFISPPCGYCLHPGNPHNQEDDDFWLIAEREEKPQEAKARVMKMQWGDWS